MPRELAFEVEDRSGRVREERLSLHALTLGGFSGRDRAAVQAHVDELAHIGVKAPDKVPVFFPMARNLLTFDDEIDVVSGFTSGEVEYVLVRTAEGLRIGVGSDETDRKAEGYSVHISKQACAKVMPSRIWRWDDVADHFDALEFRAWMTVGGERHAYQRGSGAEILVPADLIREWTGGQADLPIGSVLFSGTFLLLDGLKHGDRFEFELNDPVLGRTLSKAYRVNALPLTN